jgi:hypothetical protein
LTKHKQNTLRDHQENQKTKTKATEKML